MIQSVSLPQFASVNIWHLRLTAVAKCEVEGTRVRVFGGDRRNSCLTKMEGVIYK